MHAVYRSDNFGAMCVYLFYKTPTDLRGAWHHLFDCTDEKLHKKLLKYKESNILEMIWYSFFVFLII